MSNVISSNVYSSISGNINVITASGGIIASSARTTISVSVPTQTVIAQPIINQYDVTDAVEITMDVSLFNSRIGITKDNTNNTVLSAVPLSNSGIPTNFLSINSSELPSKINIGTIISTGRLSTVYSDFAQYISAYFGNPSGITTTLALNTAVFDGSALSGIISNSSTTLSGSIDISNVSQILTSAVSSNCFGNRNSSTGYVDISGNKRVYSTSDGFFSDDIIFIPNSGLTISFVTDTTAYSTTNSLSAYHSISNYQSQDTSGNYILNASAGIFTTTSASPTSSSIARKLAIPLLIRLANFSIYGTPAYSITSTGATITTVGAYTIYIFTSSTGSLTITGAASNAVLNTLLIAGGGSGGGDQGGGGGAGGFTQLAFSLTNPDTITFAIGRGVFHTLVLIFPTRLMRILRLQITG